MLKTWILGTFQAQRPEDPQGITLGSLKQRRVILGPQNLGTENGRILSPRERGAAETKMMSQGPLSEEGLNVWSPSTAWYLHSTSVAIRVTWALSFHPGVGSWHGSS